MQFLLLFRFQWGLSGGCWLGASTRDGPGDAQTCTLAIVQVCFHSPLLAVHSFRLVAVKYGRDHYVFAPRSPSGSYLRFHACVY